ncbi:MAG: EamA family transporter [Eubacteriales bacterium]
MTAGACFGLAFAVLCAMSKAVDTLINKSIMREISAINHALYRIFFVTPILFVASLFNWRLTWESLGYVLIYGALEAVNIWAHQSAVKKSNPLHIEIISKSKVIFTLIISFALAIDVLTPWQTVGIIIFMSGTVLTINYQSKNDEQTDWRGIFLETVSVLARTFKPFILKTCIKNSLISNETMAFVSMLVAAAALLAIFKPKLNIKEIPVKQYSLQAFVVAAGMLLSGWAITNINIVVVNAVESTTVFFVMLISYILYKKKYSALTLLGTLISVVGIVLAIVL